jgi:hypothetical protein
VYVKALKEELYSFKEMKFPGDTMVIYGKKIVSVTGTDDY